MPDCFVVIGSVDARRHARIDGIAARLEYLKRGVRGKIVARGHHMARAHDGEPRRGIGLRCNGLVLRQIAWVHERGSKTVMG